MPFPITLIIFGTVSCRIVCRHAWLSFNQWCMASTPGCPHYRRLTPLLEIPLLMSVRVLPECSWLFQYKRQALISTSAKAFHAPFSTNNKRSFRARHPPNPAQSSGSFQKYGKDLPPLGKPDGVLTMFWKTVLLPSHATKPNK